MSNHTKIMLNTFRIIKNHAIIPLFPKIIQKHEIMPSSTSRSRLLGPDKNVCPKITQNKIFTKKIKSKSVVGH